MTPRNQFKQYVLDFLSISDNDWESTAGTVSSDVQKIEEELQE